MDERLVYQGRIRGIEWAVMPSGRLSGLREWSKLPPESRAKLWDTIRRLGDQGRVENTERFKHEQGRIWAIKAWQVRIYCFMTSDGRYVLTNIAPKKRDRARPEDLAKAERIRKACINR